MNPDKNEHMHAMIFLGYRIPLEDIVFCLIYRDRQHSMQL